jgi:hypothetical protein
MECRDMDLQATHIEDLRELQALLHRIVQRMTRQIFTTPRLTQVDVSEAMVLIHRVDFPKASLVRRALPDLLRELGKKRPELFRYILSLEDAARELLEHIEETE